MPPFKQGLPVQAAVLWVGDDCTEKQEQNTFIQAHVSTGGGGENMGSRRVGRHKVDREGHAGVGVRYVRVG